MFCSAWKFSAGNFSKRALANRHIHGNYAVAFRSYSPIGGAPTLSVDPNRTRDLRIRSHSSLNGAKNQKVTIQTAIPKIELPQLDDRRDGNASNDERLGLGNRFDRWTAAVDPYVKLMRIDKPIGTWLLFWPGSWSIMMALDPGLSPASDALKNLGLFLAGAFVMRGAGCTINDMWDKDIDSKVERTKDRPLVSGAVSQRQALGFLACQLTVGLAILLQLNWYSICLGASSMALVVTYPLAKRFTDYPQIFLGLTFNWGALLGWSAMRGHLDPAVCLPLYAASLCWTVVYDTIYAHQDRLDDARIGIKSTALTFGDDTRRNLALCGLTSLAVLTTAGAMADLAWPYYAALAMAAAHVSRQIYTLDINNPKDCGDKFKSNSMVGLIIFLGILAAKWDSLTVGDQRQSSTDANSEKMSTSSIDNDSTKRKS